MKDGGTFLAGHWRSRKGGSVNPGGRFRRDAREGQRSREREGRWKELDIAREAESAREGAAWIEQGWGGATKVLLARLCSPVRAISVYLNRGWSPI